MRPKAAEPGRPEFSTTPHKGTALSSELRRQTEAEDSSGLGYLAISLCSFGTNCPH
jgi:hypothetical protein